MVKAKPYHDNEELLTMCYRCSTTNPLLNNRFSPPWSGWIDFWQPKIICYCLVVDLAFIVVTVWLFVPMIMKISF